MKSKPLILTSSTNLNDVRIVSEHYTRSLKPFQVEGIRFLNKAYLNENGAILNDDIGLGKTVQTIVFISSLLSETSSSCLIICHESNFDHWLYHLQNWSDHHATRYDKKLKPEHGFYLFSIKEATELPIFNWKIVVIDDLNPDDVIKKLKISCKFKLWLAKNNLLDNTDSLYKILKWISNKIVIPYTEFEYTNDELKTNVFLVWNKRQKLNVFCQNWLLRRTENMVSNCLPLISPEVFEDNFRMWKESKPSNESNKTLNSSNNQDKNNSDSSFIFFEESQDKNNSDSSLIILEGSQDTIELIDSESDRCSPSILSPNKNFLKKTIMMNVSDPENCKRKGTKDITGLKFKRSKNDNSNNESKNETDDIEITTFEPNNTPHFLEILFTDKKYIQSKQL